MPRYRSEESSSARPRFRVTRPESSSGSEDGATTTNSMTGNSIESVRDFHVGNNFHSTRIYHYTTGPTRSPSPNVAACLPTKLAYYPSAVRAKACFSKSFDHLTRWIGEMDDCPVMMVTGPWRVGKSTALAILVSALADSPQTISGDTFHVGAHLQYSAYCPDEDAAHTRSSRAYSILTTQLAALSSPPQPKKKVDFGRVFTGLTGRYVVVVDGLNYCTADELDELLAMLERLVSQSDKKAVLILSSVATPMVDKKVFERFGRSVSQRQLGFPTHDAVQEMIKLEVDSRLALPLGIRLTDDQLQLLYRFAANSFSSAAVVIEMINGSYGGDVLDQLTLGIAGCGGRPESVNPFSRHRAAIANQLATLTRDMPDKTKGMTVLRLAACAGDLHLPIRMICQALEMTEYSLMSYLANLAALITVKESKECQVSDESVRNVLLETDCWDGLSSSRPVPSAEALHLILANVCATRIDRTFGAIGSLGQVARLPNDALDEYAVLRFPDHRDASPDGGRLVSVVLAHFVKIVTSVKYLTRPNQELLTRYIDTTTENNHLWVVFRTYHSLVYAHGWSNTQAGRLAGLLISHSRVAHTAAVDCLADATTGPITIIGLDPPGPERIHDHSFRYYLSLRRLSIATCPSHVDDGFDISYVNAQLAVLRYRLDGAVMVLDLAEMTVQQLHSIDHDLDCHPVFALPTCDTIDPDDHVTVINNIVLVINTKSPTFTSAPWSVSPDAGPTAFYRPAHTVAVFQQRAGTVEEWALGPDPTCIRMVPVLPPTQGETHRATQMAYSPSGQSVGLAARIVELDGHESGTTVALCLLKSGRTTRTAVSFYVGHLFVASDTELYGHCRSADGKHVWVSRWTLRSGNLVESQYVWPNPELVCVQANVESGFFVGASVPESAYGTGYSVLSRPSSGRRPATLGRIKMVALTDPSPVGRFGFVPKSALFSVDGRWIAFGSRHAISMTLFWISPSDRPEQAPSWLDPGATVSVASSIPMAFSPRSDRLVIQTDQHDISIINLETGKVSALMLRSRAVPTTRLVSFLSSSQIVVFEDDSLIVYDLDRSSMLVTILDVKDWYHDPSSHLIRVLHRTRNVFTDWSLYNGTITARLKNTFGTVRADVFGRLGLTHLQNIDKVARQFKRAGRSTWSLSCFSPDGQLLASTTADKRHVEIVQVTTRSVITTISTNHKIVRVRFVSSTSVCISHKDRISVWDGCRCQMLFGMTFPGLVDPDDPGNVVASADESHFVHTFPLGMIVFSRVSGPKPADADAIADAVAHYSGSTDSDESDDSDDADDTDTDDTDSDDEREIESDGNIDDVSLHYHYVETVYYTSHESIQSAFFTPAGHLWVITDQKAVLLDLSSRSRLAELGSIFLPTGYQRILSRPSTWSQHVISSIQPTDQRDGTIHKRDISFGNAQFPIWFDRARRGHARVANMMVVGKMVYWINRLGELVCLSLGKNVEEAYWSDKPVLGNRRSVRI